MASSDYPNCQRRYDQAGSQNLPLKQRLNLARKEIQSVLDLRGEALGKHLGVVAPIVSGLAK